MAEIIRTVVVFQTGATRGHTIMSELARVTLDSDGHVQVFTKIFADWATHGLRANGGDGSTVWPQDGTAFLNAVVDDFSKGGRCFAVDSAKGDVIPPQLLLGSTKLTDMRVSAARYFGIDPARIHVRESPSFVIDNQVLRESGRYDPVTQQLTISAETLQALCEGTMSLPWPDWTEQQWRDAPIRTLGGEHSGNFGHTGGAGGKGHPGGSGAARSDSGTTGKDRVAELKAEWATINSGLLDHLHHPDAPVVQAAMDKQKSLVKELYRINADPGDITGIGVPGGPRDMVIVGAGPGGLTSAIAASSDGLDTLIIDANTVTGGQAKYSSRIENYPGFPIGVTGEQLTANMFEQSQRLGAETKLGVRVTGLTYDPDTDLKTLTLSNGETVQARSVILAGGVEFRRMNFPGSDTDGVIYGDAKQLAKEGTGRPVAVIGGSNGAAQAALGCIKTSPEVYLVSRSAIEKSMSDYQVQALRANPNIHIMEGTEIDRIEKNDAGGMGSMVLKNGQSIPCKAVGIFLGGSPNVSWLPSHIVSKGRVDVNNDLETKIPGVFAVGDTRNGSIGRIGAAVGDGMLAERNAFQYFERVKNKQKKAS